MDARVETPVPERSIGDLFGQLAEDGRTLVRSEVDLYKKIARRRAAKASGGFIALVVGALLLNAALVTLLIAFVLGLAPLVGPVFGGLIVLAATVLVALLLVKYGAGKMAALSGDEEERAALQAGERLG